MGETFYGFTPKYKIGEKVYVQMSKYHSPTLGRIVGITFELVGDDSMLEITMYYDIEIDGLGGLYSFDESCLKPLNAFLPKIAVEIPVKQEDTDKYVNYAEYTVDELLDAYSAFKSAPGFDYVIKKIENELKRRKGKTV